MKIPSLLLAAAGTTLLGASPPMDRMDGPGASAGYPPCSAGVRDRCIQLYERGVANPRNLAANAQMGPDRVPRRYAHGSMGPTGPRYGDLRERRVAVLARNDYPPCGGPVDDRCIQAPPVTIGGAPVSRRVAARVRYDREVVRAGERG